MLVIFAILIVSTAPSDGLTVSRSDVNGTDIKIGATYVFTSMMDKSVITVNGNGDVTTESFTNSLKQRWTVVNHPNDPDALEFKQDLVPYNELSGFEDPPENPGIYPRPLSFARREPLDNIETWNILIRRRWCIQANGVGDRMDIDDCESFMAPWQLWKIDEVIDEK